MDHRPADVYATGFTLPETIVGESARIPEKAWQIAYDAEGEPRPGACALEVTGSAGTAVNAAGNAGDCAQGTPAPAYAAAPDRHRRTPADRIRHHHHGQAAPPAPT